MADDAPPADPLAVALEAIDSLLAEARDGADGERLDVLERMRAALSARLGGGGNA